MAPVGGYDLRAPFPDGSTHPFDRCESAKANNHVSRAYSMRRGLKGSEFEGAAQRGSRAPRRRRVRSRRREMRYCWRGEKGQSLRNCAEATCCAFSHHLIFVLHVNLCPQHTQHRPSSPHHAVEPKSSLLTHLRSSYARTPEELPAALSPDRKGVRTPPKMMFAAHFLQHAPSAACSSTKSRLKRSRRG